MVMPVSLRWLAAASGMLALAACASEPAGRQTASAGPPGGTWVVTDVFPAGPVTDSGSAPRGQMVRLDAGMAGDAAGRACPWPSYRDGVMPLGTVLGASSGNAGALATMVGILDVSCAGQRYSTYAVMPDGSLLSRHGPWLLRLEHGEKLATNPAPMMADAPMMLMPPPAMPAAPAAKAAAAAPVATLLVYLASYKTEAWARKGWGILAAQSASLKTMEPVTRSVELKGKGTFVRLFAPAKDAADGKRICSELGKAITECGIFGREK